jgi:hypothetical protein
MRFRCPFCPTFFECEDYTLDPKARAASAKKQMLQHRNSLHKKEMQEDLERSLALSPPYKTPAQREDDRRLKLMQLEKLAGIR